MTYRAIFGLLSCAIVVVACDSNVEKVYFHGCDLDSAVSWLRDRREHVPRDSDSANLYLGAMFGYGRDPSNCLMMKVRSQGLYYSWDLSRALMECANVSENMRGSCDSIVNHVGYESRKLDSICGAYIPQFTDSCAVGKRVTKESSRKDSAAAPVRGHYPGIYRGVCEDSSWVLVFRTDDYAAGWRRMKKLPNRN